MCARGCPPNTKPISSFSGHTAGHWVPAKGMWMDIKGIPAGWPSLTAPCPFPTQAIGMEALGQLGSYILKCGAVVSLEPRWLTGRTASPPRHLPLTVTVKDEHSQTLLTAVNTGFIQELVMGGEELRSIPMCKEGTGCFEGRMREWEMRGCSV